MTRCLSTVREDNRAAHHVKTRWSGTWVQERKPRFSQLDPSGQGCLQTTEFAWENVFLSGRPMSVNVSLLLVYAHPPNLALHTTPSWPHRGWPYLGVFTATMSDVFIAKKSMFVHGTDCVYIKFWLKNKITREKEK